jgi:hypothetical protein
MTEDASPTWSAVVAGDPKRYPPHFCPTSMLADLLKDMAEHGVEVHGHGQVPSFVLNAPKAHRLVKHQVAMFPTDGVVIKVPAQDYEQVLSDLRLMQPGTFPSGKPFRRALFHEAIVVMSDEQRRALIEKMEGLMPEVMVAAASDDAQTALAVARHNEKNPDDPLPDLAAASADLATKKRERGLTN